MRVKLTNILVLTDEKNEQYQDHLVVSIISYQAVNLKFRFLKVFYLNFQNLILIL